MSIKLVHIIISTNIGEQKMNLKTGITALTIALSPVAINAQKATPKVTKPVTEQVAKATGNYGKAMVKKSLGQPALQRSPKPEMANLRVVRADNTQVQYDGYGNISALFNAKGQRYREISRDPQGKLTGYVDNTFKKNGAKDTETIYSNGWATDGSVAKFAEHKYNGDGTATVTHFKPSGEVLQSNNYNTKVIDGEEQITNLIME